MTDEQRIEQLKRFGGNPAHTWRTQCARCKKALPPGAWKPFCEECEAEMTYTPLPTHKPMDDTDG